MSGTLVVETSDLAAAAHTLSDQVGHRLWTRVGATLDDAASCTGMAGDDPAGLQWAEVYERAAGAAAQAAEDATNGAFTLASLLSATAENYARADSASTTGGQRAVEAAVASLPAPEVVTLATRFGGVGGGPPDAPLGWSYVEHYVRLVWPNGHQDRLRQAGAAWRRSASALSEAADDVELALLGPLLDGLPEWRDIRDTCWSLSDQLRHVAHAHRSLASSCERFAQHLDVAHASLLHEIRIFLIETGAIEIGGNLLSALTVGVLEEPTQGLELARFAATVAAIVRDITELSVAVRELLLALPLVEQVSVTVTASLRELLGVRVVWAEVDGVPGLRVLAVAHDGRTGAALTHLADDADLPAELRTALDSRGGAWNKLKTLAQHFDDHGADFGATSASDYAAKAKSFFERGVDGTLEVKVDARTGDILMYDPATNTFGSFTSDGGVRTFFKPDRPNYWAEQRGDTVSW